MSFLFFAFAAVVTPPSGLVPNCSDARPRPVDASQASGPQRLDKLPPAEAYLAVVRTENGCMRPVLVREERQRRR